MASCSRSGARRRSSRSRPGRPTRTGEPRSLVYVWAPLGRDVKPSHELYHWAAVDGQQMRFGTVTVIDDKDKGTCFIQFDHTILGDYMDPAELVTAVAAVMYTADDLDEIVHDAVRRQALHGPDGVIRDRVRDEAIAVAKAWSHPEVDLRHVLWGLVRVLGPAAPTEVSPATVKGFLQPAGSSYSTPTVAEAAETVLASIDSEASAIAAVLDLAARLGPGGADAPGADSPATPPDRPAGPGTGSSAGRPQARASGPRPARPTWRRLPPHPTWTMGPRPAPAVTPKRRPKPSSPSSTRSSVWCRSRLPFGA